MCANFGSHDTTGTSALDRVFTALQNRVSLLRWARTILMSKTSIVIIGGTGFVGTQIAAELTSRGHRLNLLTRRRERKRQVLMLPTLTLNDADVHDSRALNEALAGADVVISMAGILHETHRGDFDKVHADLPGKIVDACCENKVPRLLHIGALGAESNAPSAYLRSKAQGEAAIEAGAERGLNTTVFRPSVVFGPRDDFINRFAKLLAMTPIALPLACPRARLAPVFVGDVANAIANSIKDKRTFGQTYNLCGPEQMSLLEIVRLIARISGNQRTIVPLNNILSMLQAQVLQRLTGKLFTMDNYRSLQVDSVCDRDDLATLGVQAHGLEAIVPTYLGSHSRQENLGRFRAHASRD